MTKSPRPTSARLFGGLFAIRRVVTLLSIVKSVLAGLYLPQQLPGPADGAGLCRQFLDPAHQIGQIVAPRLLRLAKNRHQIGPVPFEPVFNPTVAGHAVDGHRIAVTLESDTLRLKVE